ncbi:MAG: LOG family protein [Phycisphaerae bacterium]|nr:LOG family protein [Phycisphaerae bacterium]
MSDTKTITVFGSSDPKPGEPAYDEAHLLGQAIAKAGWVLCNGGYGGTMEAGCRGAAEAGGRTIGVSCAAFGRSGVNQWVQREIHTEDLNSRVNNLIELGDAYVVLPGSTGTLLELAAAWELANKGFLAGKPIFLLGEFWVPVVAVIAKASPRALNHVEPARSVEQLVESLTARFKAS